MSRVVHPIPPLYRADSRVLILGSFPSVKSREGAFFYHHPQNRFWRVIAAVTNWPVPQSVEEKTQMMLANHIALWDSIAIRDVIPNDLRPILRQTQIRRIFCNGAASYQYYQKYLLSQTGMEAVKLPSTSPANASWTLERLTRAWAVILCEE